MGFLIPDFWGIWIFSFSGCVLIEYAMLNSLARRQRVGLDSVFSYLKFFSEVSLSFLLSTVLDFRLCRSIWIQLKLILRIVKSYPEGLLVSLRRIFLSPMLIIGLNSQLKLIA